MIGIFIPYRNRKKHLDILLDKLSKYPNISIHVLEQDNNHLFNRGKLFNIGFKEYVNKYSYFIFHDVDLVPQDEDYNYFPTIPTHYSCFCEQFNYRLLDVQKDNYLNSKMFGGVIGFKKSDFIKCNGYSNLYEGWGCEDNDLFERVLKTIGKISRKSWTYNSLSHESSYESNLNPNLYNNLSYLKSDYNFKTDGLNKLIKVKNDKFNTHCEYTFETQVIGQNVFFHKINFDCYYQKKNIITVYINELKHSTIKTIINFAHSEKKSVLLTSSLYSIPVDLKYFYSTSNSSYILKTYKSESDNQINSWANVFSYNPISTVNGLFSYLIHLNSLYLKFLKF
jgi:beta-1,4-galactosyltransferase 1/beta-1,4-galactosyltransferase 2